MRYKIWYSSSSDEFDYDNAHVIQAALTFLINN